MKRPVWFHKDNPLHWTPCAWQGWAAVGVFVALLSGWMAQWTPRSPVVAAIGAVCGAAVLVAVAAGTDDTHG